jgi:hypothetical protein
MHLAKEGVVPTLASALPGKMVPVALVVFPVRLEVVVLDPDVVTGDGSATGSIVADDVCEIYHITGEVVAWARIGVTAFRDIQRRAKFPAVRRKGNDFSKPDPFAAATVMGTRTPIAPRPNHTVDLTFFRETWFQFGEL